MWVTIALADRHRREPPRRRRSANRIVAAETFPDLDVTGPLRLVSDTAALRTDRRATNVIAPHLCRARIR